jgi:4-hydroxy-tetrahydrodipicolinate synthase
MLTRNTVAGPWCALISTWNPDSTLDESRFRKEVAWYANTGVKGVYTGGTTGEFYTQDDDLFKRINDIAIDEAHKAKLPIQAGITSLCTRSAIKRGKYAVKAGADALQVALPFWLELKDDEAEGFFMDLAQAFPSTPLILYHTGRAKKKFTPDQIVKLAAAIPHFVGMKDGGCSLETLSAMHKLVPDLAIGGGEHDMIERAKLGGRGGYFSATGLCPHAVVRLYQMCEAKQFDQAAPLQKILHALIMDVAVPWVTGPDGLFDSAVDRVFRNVACGPQNPVELPCQKPYRSASQKHVDTMRAWAQKTAPWLLDKTAKVPF